MALAEDVGEGDITASALLGPDTLGRARIEARQELVCCGLELAEMVYAMLDSDVSFTRVLADGETAGPMTVLATVEGRLDSILTGERTALNFLQRMCGVATLSRRYFEKAAGRVTILDSRKTIPGWRWLDKLAVRTGGCSNHRMGLFDGILIKDNHIKACGGITAAVKRALKNAPEGIKVEVEVESMEELTEAMEAGAQIVMLDNFSPGMIARASEVAAGKVLLEVSGGVTLDNLEDHASAGSLDYISVGALTHSAPAADIAMEFL
jgi:nicotinate-nucleotide pyrophosphorylase (carboxylating)